MDSFARQHHSQKSTYVLHTKTTFFHSWPKWYYFYYSNYRKAASSSPTVLLSVQLIGVRDSETEKKIIYFK